MKRLNSVLLCVLLTIGLTGLVGCAGGGDGHREGPAEPAPRGPVEEDSRPTEESAETKSSAPAESDIINGGIEEDGVVDEGSGAPVESDLQIPTAMGDGEGGDANSDNRG